MLTCRWLKPKVQAWMCFKNNSKGMNLLSTKLIASLSLLLILCNHALAVTQQNPEIIKPVHDANEYRLITLDNGLDVLLISSPGASKAAASITVGVGSHADPKDMQGLAHYLEHMVYMSSQKHPEANTLSNYVSSNGGFANATTWNEHTQYFFSIDTEHFEDALDIFSSNLSAPLLDPKYSEKEINAVDEEWQIRRSDPQFIEYLALTKLLSENHPARKLGSGNKSTLTQLGIGKLNESTRSFFEEYYYASNMKAVLVSEVSVDVLERYAREYFSSITSKSTRVSKQTALAAKEDISGKRLDVQITGAAEQIRIAFPIKRDSDEWQHKSLHYLHHVLSSRVSTSLLDTLQKAGLVHSHHVSFNNAEFGDFGLFKISFQPTDKGSENIDVIAATTLAYIQSLKNEGASGERVSMFAKGIQRNMRSFRGLNPIDAATTFGFDMFSFPPSQLLNAPFYFELSELKLSETLAQFTSESLSIIKITESPVDGTAITYTQSEYKIQDIDSRNKNDWASLALDVSLPAAISIKNDEEDVIQAQYIERPESVFSEDGVYALLTHSCCITASQTRLDIIFNSTLTHSDAKHFVASHVLHNIFRKRTQAYAETMQESLGLYVYAHNDVYANTLIHAMGSAKYAPEVALGLMEEFVALQFTIEDIKTEVGPYVRSMNAFGKNSLESVAFDAMLNEFAVFPYKWSPQERVEALESLDLDFVQSLHQQLIDNAAIEVFIAGNMSKKQAETFAQKVRNAIPNARETQAFYPNNIVEPKAGRWLDIRRTAEKEGVMLIYSVRALDKRESVYDKLLLLSNIYQAPFFNRLRTELQMAYALKAQASSLAGYPSFGIVIESNNTSLQGLVDGVKSFNAEFVGILKRMDVKDFESFKLQVLRQITDKQGFWQEVSQQRLDFIFPPEETPRERVDAMLSLTKEEFTDFFQNVVIGSESEKVMVQVRGGARAKEAFAKF